MFVYVGTYTVPPSGHGEGIYIFRFDEASGALEPVKTVSGIASPSFLAASPEGDVVYAVSETDGGSVVAFARNAESGDLTQLNSQPTHGSAPCYVSTSADGSAVFVANYMSGNIASFPV